ncbi:hypothetical protein F9278_09070 [Streptomyces phaeolivaceus]|uniref:Uncharacterized protein n=1 Tax=Streptomyces phaeolivaceus TaxID=2653200 RepID=A0A5P8K149_9ACTN|nr:hypothetical protein [Streptomyces phaeolivaceus]QFQ96327.1 hypothetical protein F9278_09070 [Streptomyces phaeolivaceus]
MTDLTRKRFAQLGQQLQYDQLGTVRRQAEGWRNGLTGLTGLVGAVFVLKGRESVAGMPDLWRWTTAALLVLAFLLLLSGALRAVRAAHGQLGERTWLSGDLLFAAVLDEVERTQNALTSARRRSVTGLCLIVAAVAVSWVVPADDPAAVQPARAHVLVSAGGETRCGELVMSDRRAVTIKVGKRGALRSIPAARITSVTPVDRC